MDRRFALSDARASEFRKGYLGRDQHPRPASREECKDAIRRGVKDGLEPRELKDFVNAVRSYAQSNEAPQDVDPETKQDILNLCGAASAQWRSYRRTILFGDSSEEFRIAAQAVFRRSKEAKLGATSNEKSIESMVEQNRD